MTRGSEIDAIRALLSSKPRPVGWPERRKRLDDVGSVWPVADDVKVTTVDVHGVPGEWSIVPGSDPSRVLMFFHGGGYCLSIGSGAPVPNSVRRCTDGMALSAGPEYSCCAHRDWRRQRRGGPHISVDRSAARCTGEAAGLRLVNFAMDGFDDVGPDTFKQ